MSRTLALFFAVLLVACAVHARGGDGGDYSGGGSSSSSGSDWGGSDYSSSDDYSSSSDYDYGDSNYSGGGGGDPVVGLFVFLVVVGVAFAAILWGKFSQSRFYKTIRARRRAGQILRTQRPPPLGDIRRADPNFSSVLFPAFAHLVYVKYHESRGGMARRSAEEFAVAPYLAEHLRRAVRESKESIAQVIIGELNIASVEITRAHTRIGVNFKSNVVYKDSRGRLSRMLLVEQLTFSRPGGVLTREPERVLALGCPSCGSKQEPAVDGRCPDCGSIVGDGRMDWQVTAVRELERPRLVTGSVAGGGGVEPGTDLPTIVDPKLKSSERALMMRDPAFWWREFNARAEIIFLKLQEGWTERDESILRPYELDHVYDAHRIWLERYRDEGVRNVLKDIKIEYIKPVKIEHDAWFDAITVRIRASMIDYKESDDGRHLSGDRSKRKVFTEYFTLVRRAAHGSRKHEPFKCPQCGAPLDKVSRLGVCGYCDTRITTGDFDWVLALITQDEEYRG